MEYLLLNPNHILGLMDPDNVAGIAYPFRFLMQNNPTPKELMEMGLLGESIPPHMFSVNDNIIMIRSELWKEE